MSSPLSVSRPAGEVSAGSSPAGDPMEAARQALGRQLAAFREAAGIRQQELARWLCYSRSSVANVEIGRQNAPRTFWCRADEVLHTGGVLAAGYDALRVADRRRRDLTARAMTLTMPWPQGAGSSSSAQARDCEDHAGLSPVEALIGELTGISWPFHIDDRGGRIGFGDLPLTDISGLIVTYFLRLDDERGGDTLLQPLAGFVDRIIPVVDDRPDEGLAGFGQLCQLAGWLALDAGRAGAARRYLTMAVHAGHETDDPGLAASGLAYLSLQDGYRGRIRSALALAKTALDTTAGCATPLTRTMLANRLARAQAACGNTSATLTSLDYARTAFSQGGSEPEPTWVTYVDEVEVEAQAGACYLELRMPTEARRALTTALGRLSEVTPHRVRDQVHYLCRLAHCCLLECDVEQACHHAGLAVRAAQALGSRRVNDRLLEFHDQLAVFGENRAAASFREEFAVATARPRIPAAS